MPPKRTPSNVRSTPRSVRHSVVPIVLSAEQQRRVGFLSLRIPGWVAHRPRESRPFYTFRIPNLWKLDTNRNANHPARHDNSQRAISTHHNSEHRKDSSVFLTAQSTVADNTIIHATGIDEPVRQLIATETSPRVLPAIPELPALDSCQNSEVASAGPVTPCDHPVSARSFHLSPASQTGSLALASQGIMSVQSPSPAQPPNQTETAIKNVIQDLFTIQQHIHTSTPGPEDALPGQYRALSRDLTRLSDVTSAARNPGDPIQSIRVAPDIIDYVDDGRNPDIYTRDFVELVQRGNAVVNGKQKAFSSFSKIFADVLEKEFENDKEFTKEVELIMGDAGNVKKGGRWYAEPGRVKEEPKLTNGHTK